MSGISSLNAATTSLQSAAPRFGNRLENTAALGSSHTAKALEHEGSCRSGHCSHQALNAEGGAQKDPFSNLMGSRLNTLA